jgi:hypothetical protein
MKPVLMASFKTKKAPVKESSLPAVHGDIPYRQNTQQNSLSKLSG